MSKQKTEDGSEHIDNIGTVLTPLWLLLDWVTDPLSKQPRSLEDRGCAREKPGAGDGLQHSYRVASRAVRTSTRLTVLR